MHQVYREKKIYLPSFAIKDEIRQVIAHCNRRGKIHKRPYIKYVVGGGGRRGRKERECQRVFVGGMKYFRHILMGHERFFKIFDGPRNIFLCSIFIIIFFK